MQSNKINEIKDDILYVTKPFLPPLEKLTPYLEKIWESRILTNNGPFHQKLEEELCKYLGVKYISLFTNATIALVTALQALKIKGEVITTPYSFVATSHSILWNGISPVFVDIEPETLNIDSDKIEFAITEATTAIMPVHCYGNPCNVDAIQKIADKYQLKIIYDAAHAFGVKYQGNSILNHGDLSVLSFHATKVFNTFEGGAIVCSDEHMKKHIDNLKNFGFINETTVTASGINGKMSEFNAAIGLLQLEYFEEVTDQRKRVDLLYRKLFKNLKGISCLNSITDVVMNYAYFPILIKNDYGLTRDCLYDKLRNNGVHARRYFYPLISDFPMYREISSAQKENLKFANQLAEEVLCLPIYPEMNSDQIERVAKIILDIDK